MSTVVGAGASALDQEEDPLFESYFCFESLRLLRESANVALDDTLVADERSPDALAGRAEPQVETKTELKAEPKAGPKAG